ncbi:NAD-dependent epimerase/dehydratase family protein [Ancylobacter mangrovi]|uniref:NAD-dependent epimerase/dehydratase family protein n=1 Tax=Ancylobacter mangrovi TaxID=2972472 RepID=UPI00216239AA|nr:NAD-dependent epimerase/dehydratase family protein [Ancylobacter mangrovi]MCS0503135.1 NAD-dependent epimerase/dehydratase family protein [Ancylobacter mangrovi]
MDGKHLVLGGSGFVGRHVALALAKAGHEVVVADRSPLPNDLPALLRDRVSWRFFELDDAPWPELIEDVAVVHHYAWSSVPASANDCPALDLASNVGPTIALLETLRARGAGDAPRLVFSSSGGTVYGRLRRVPVQEDHPLSPLNAYGAGKAAAENYISCYRNQYGLDCRVARLANPFGAGQNLARGQGAVTTFLYRALTHEPIVIWGNGEVVRDYVHISDVASGLMTLACTEDVGEQHVFNIGSGIGVSLNAIVAELETALGRRLEVRRKAGRPYDVPVSVLDISMMHDLLNWRPWLSFSDGIRRTLSDFERGYEVSTLD